MEIREEYVQKMLGRYETKARKRMEYYKQHPDAKSFFPEDVRDEEGLKAYLENMECRIRTYYD